MNHNDQIRYSRHFQLPEIGKNGQEKLLNSRVLIVGAGGLGSPVIQYLAAAGVGYLEIIDQDKIELSNLQRQVIFKTKDINQYKSDIAAHEAMEINPGIKCISHSNSLSNQNAIELISGVDLVIDCTDNFPTRYLINDACVLTEKPFIYGSIYRFEGQVSVFNHPDKEGSASTYRDLFESPPPPEAVPSCAEGGVIGTLPGIVGSVQANEAIKLLVGNSDLLSGKLWLMDALSMKTRIIKISPLKTSYKVEKLINYQYFCNSHLTQQTMKEVNVRELKNLFDKNEDIFLVDVREQWENEMANLGGILIPQGNIMDEYDKIPKDKQVIVYCRSGRRSANVILWLEENYQYNNLYNLEGGILAWADEIDPSVPKY